MLKKFFVALIVVLFVAKPHARADSGHEFIMSVTYGTLAGTLLGVASLAFVDKPSDHLQRIARGASLGLYAGILLGLYVVYAVPDENEELDKILPPEDSQPPETYMPIVYPMISDRGQIDGAGVQLTILHF